jgi:hypothetical protein
MIDPNYRFTLPRAARTGQMAEQKRIETPPPGLMGFIDHKMSYAPRVYELHRRRGNDFMARFVRNAQDEIQEQFDKALTLAMQDIARAV